MVPVRSVHRSGGIDAERISAVVQHQQFSRAISREVGCRYAPRVVTARYPVGSDLVTPSDQDQSIMGIPIGDGRVVDSIAVEVTCRYGLGTTGPAGLIINHLH